MKKFLPFLFIFLLWFVFSSPYFFKSQVPFPSRYFVTNFSPWSSYANLFGTVKNSAMPDIITQIYPWKHYTIEMLKGGQIPFWNPYSLAGTWHLANSQTGVLSPFNVLFFLLPFVDAWSLFILLQPLMAGIFMYMYVRSSKRSEIASLIAAVSFMFCGFMTVWMEYGTLGYAVLFLPLALFSIEKIIETKNKWYCVLLAITFPLSFFSGHLQTSIYFLLVILAYILFLRKELGKQIGTVIMSFVSGLLLSGLQLLPAFEAFQLSPRSQTLATNEIIPWQYIVTFFAPDFYGHPVTRNIWFGHYAEWNGYAGVVALYLAHIGIFQKNKRVWFFIGLFLVSLLMSYDTPLIHFIITLHTPFFSSVAASRVIVMASFSLAVLASFGLDSVIEKSNKRSVYIGTSIFAAVTGIYWIVVILGQKVWHISDFAIAKQNLILPTAFFILSAALVLCITKLAKTKKVILLTSILLLLISSIDMYRFSTKWVPFEPKNLMYSQISVLSSFEQAAASEGRVLGGFGAEVGVYYHVPLVDGYDSFTIARYGQFINYLQDGKYRSSYGNVVSFPRVGRYTVKALNLLGASTIFHRISDGRPGWEFHFWDYLDKGITLQSKNDVYEIFHNANAYPRAFFVDQYVVETNPQKILSTMFSEKFDLRHSVVLEKQINTSLTNGDVLSSSFKPQGITIHTRTSGTSLLFLSEVYAPGWNAYLDGKRTEILRADYTFRSVIVPRGSHIIVMKYTFGS